MHHSAEVYLISAVLRTSDHIVPASRGITSEYFHGVKDEWVWIERYIEEHSRTPSTSAFRRQFPEFPMKKADDVEHFCEEVVKNHARVLMTRSVNDITDDIVNGFYKRAADKLAIASIQAQQTFQGGHKDSDVFHDYDDVMEEILRRKAKADEFGYSGVPTGIPSLDELTGGIQPGWSVVVAARSGVGKTRMLTRFAFAAAASGYCAQYDALEQTRAEISTQVHTYGASEYGRKVFKSMDLLRGKNFSSAEYKQLLQTLSTKVKGKFHVADNSHGAINALTIQAQIERNKPDILFLDQFSLMEGVEDYKNAGALSGQLKRIATKYKVPIVTACQFNRKRVESKEASLEHLAIADKIGQDADLVLSINQVSRNVLSITVTKYRHGRSGQVIYVSFQPNIGVMEEVTFDEAMAMKDRDEDMAQDTAETKFSKRKKGSFSEHADRRLAEPRQLSRRPVATTPKPRTGRPTSTKKGGLIIRIPNRVR